MARAAPAAAAGVQTATQRLHRQGVHARISAQPAPPFTGGSLVGGGSVSSTLLAGGVLVGGGLLSGAVQVVLP